MCVIYPVRASYNFVTHYRGYAEQMMLRSPEIRMRITDQGGDDIRTAMVSIYIHHHHTPFPVFISMKHPCCETVGG